MVLLVLFGFIYNASFGLILHSHFLASKESEIPDFQYGYVNVDKQNDGNLFYWFYGSENRSTRSSDPLIVFLQGGPGASDIFADLCELGPENYFCFDENEGDISRREYRWNMRSNLLLVDSPVGSGFSYVIGKNGFKISDEEVAEDLIVLMKEVVGKIVPSLQNLPFYIMGESYGGKFVAKFSVKVIDEIRKGGLKLDFKGVGLGDTWINPLSCVESYGSFLTAMNHIDENERIEVDQFAKRIKELMMEGEFADAEDTLYQQELFYTSITKLNYFNFMLHEEYNMTALTNYVNSEKYRSKYGGIIPDWVRWQNINETVRSHLRPAFMKDAMKEIEYLLEGGYKVSVFQGQYDVCVNVLCTLNWIHKLQWSGIEEWKKSKKQVFLFDKASKKLAFVKKWKNLSFYQVEGAGHMIPMDNSVVMFQILQDLVQ